MQDQIIGVHVTSIPGGKSFKPFTEADLSATLERMQHGQRTRVLSLCTAALALEDARTFGAPQAAIGGWVANAYRYPARAVRIVAMPDGAFRLDNVDCHCARGARATTWTPRLADARRMVGLRAWGGK